MGDRRRVHCTCCGKSRSEQHEDGTPVGEITWGGNCMRCAELLLTENVIGIATKTGPAHLRRLRGIAKRLEADYLDALGRKP